MKVVKLASKYFLCYKVILLQRSSSALLYQPCVVQSIY